MKPLEKILNRFVLVILIEMAIKETYKPLNLKYLRDYYDLEPKKVGMLFGRYRKRLKRELSIFDIEYKPGWEDDVIVRRK